MIMLVLSLIWAGLIAWLISRAIAQNAAYEQLAATAPLLEKAPIVAVIVPARDEEANIQYCLHSLLQQDYPAERLRIIVVDDNSTDATRQIVQSIATSDRRVKLLIGAPLPTGWTGKTFACGQGAAAAGDADWFCFIDADVRSATPLLRYAVGRAEKLGIDMLSLEPFQQMGSFWERVILPAGFFLLAFSQDLRRVNDPARPEAFANGQFILIRREAYLSVGGHAAVRTEIAEDSALARRTKHAGHHLELLGAESLLRTRMYRNLTTLWLGLSKNVVEMVGGTSRALLFAVVAFAIAAAAIGLPLWAWLNLILTPFSWTSLCAVVAATAGSGALLGVHVGTAIHFRIPASYGLLFPLGYLVGAILLLDSVRRRFQHRAVWKGRSYGDLAAANSSRSNAPREAAHLRMRQPQ